MENTNKIPDYVYVKVEPDEGLSLKKEMAESMEPEGETVNIHLYPEKVEDPLVLESYGHGNFSGYGPGQAEDPAQPSTFTDAMADTYGDDTKTFAKNEDIHHPNSCETKTAEKSSGLSHPDTPYARELCNEELTSKDSVTHTSKQGKDNKRHVCGTCGMRFKKSQALKLHIRTHTGEKPFECETCKRRFSRKHGLKAHMLTHTGVKPHVCDICNLAFAQSSRLKDHKLTHEDISKRATLYSCEICQKKFTKKANMRRHALLHDGERPYECDICFKQFTQSGSLKLHKLTHSGEKTHTCHLCDRKFLLKSILKNHLKRIHQCEDLEPSIQPRHTKSIPNLNHHGVAAGEHTRSQSALEVCDKQPSASSSLPSHGAVRQELPVEIPLKAKDSDASQPSSAQDDVSNDGEKFSIKDEIIQHNQINQETNAQSTIVEVSLNPLSHPKNSIPDFKNYGVAVKEESHSLDEQLPTSSSLPPYPQGLGPQELSNELPHEAEESDASQPSSPQDANVCDTSDDGESLKDEFVQHDQIHQEINERNITVEVSLDPLSHPKNTHTSELCKEEFTSNTPDFKNYVVAIKIESCDEQLLPSSSLPPYPQELGHQELSDEVPHELPHEAEESDASQPSSPQNDVSDSDDGETFPIKDEMIHHDQTHQESNEPITKVEILLDPLSHPQKPYTSELCKKEFTSKDRPKKRRNRGNRDPKPHVCGTCGMKFKKSQVLKHHNRTHTGEKPFACETCDKRFAKKDGLKSHMLIHTGIKPHVCDICDMGFTQSSHLKTHKATHEDINSRATLYSCEICQKKFTKRGNMTRHALLHDGERPYECDICFKQFTQSGSLKLHKLTHSGEKTHACDICNRKFLLKSILKNHLKRIHQCEDLEPSIQPRPEKNPALNKLYSLDALDIKFSGSSSLPPNAVKLWQCNICNKSFSRKDHLKTHQLTHIPKDCKPYTCKTCEKKFASVYGLKIHERLHTEKKPFVCDVCNKAFKQLGHLNTHILIHTGVKSYSCDICNKEFAQAGNMKAHRLMHEDIRKEPTIFTCEICEKQFTKKSNLKRHALLHTGQKPYACDICNKEFRQSSNLNIHRLIHTGEKQHACDICGKKFLLKSMLKAHRRTHEKHPVPVECVYE